MMNTSNILMKDQLLDNIQRLEPPSPSTTPMLRSVSLQPSTSAQLRPNVLLTSRGRSRSSPSTSDEPSSSFHRHLTKAIQAIKYNKHEENDDRERFLGGLVLNHNSFNDNNNNEDHWQQQPQDTIVTSTASTTSMDKKEEQDDDSYLQDFWRWAHNQTVAALPAVCQEDHPLFPSNIVLSTSGPHQEVSLLLDTITHTMADCLQQLHRKHYLFSYRPHPMVPGRIDICSKDCPLKFILQLWRLQSCTTKGNHSTTTNNNQIMTTMLTTHPAIVVELQRRRGCPVFMHHLRRSLFLALLKQQQQQQHYFVVGSLATGSSRDEDATATSKSPPHDATVVTTTTNNKNQHDLLTQDNQLLLPSSRVVSPNNQARPSVFPPPLRLSLS